MAKAIEEKKSLEKHLEQARKNDFKIEGDEQAAHDFFITRKEELIKARQNIVGQNIEEVWRGADRAYIPHTLKKTGKKTLVSDDDLGWRSTPVHLGRSDDWQEDSVPTNPYVKVQTALSILIDRNPTAVFKGFQKKFESSSILHKELHKRNWDMAKSKQMLKVLILNGAKYGVMFGMTKPLKIQRDVRDLVEFNPSDFSKNRYDNKTITVYDDVYRWALNPWNVWIDDMAKPGDFFSLNDWFYFKDYSFEKARELFQHLPNWKNVVPKPIDLANPSSGQIPSSSKVRNNTVRLWFYENLERDSFYVETDDSVPLINEPIPHFPENKRLSLWYAPWTLRHQDTAYGIGLYEAMRNDYKLFMKVRNMTVDQLVQSIYKEWFYEGTNTLQNTGEMLTKPGTGRQVTNAKNIQWNNVPSPGQDAWKGLDWISNEIDSSSGITQTLEGELSPKAKAFDIAQAREASLKRLRTPLDNISFALEQDAYISVTLYEEIYSIPEVEEVFDQGKIQDFLTQKQEETLPPEISLNTIEQFDESTGELVPGLEVSKFRVIPLLVDRDERGNITESKEEKFFSPRPKDLAWEGMISVKGQSIIAESPLLEKSQKSELFSQIGSLFQFPPELYLPSVKQLLKVYDEDPEDWLPLTWQQFEKQTGGQLPEEPLFVPQEQQSQEQQNQQPEQRQSAQQQPTPSSPSPGAEGGGSQVQRFLSRLNPFGNTGT